MPHVTVEFQNLIGKGDACKGFSLEDESAAHQLVGGVMAHQGEDG